MPIRFLIFATLILFLQAPIALALEFKGVQSRDIKRLQQKYKSAFSKTITDLRPFDQIMIELIESKNYQSAELLLENGEYIIKAVPVKKVGSIKILGNSQVPSKDLNELITVPIGSRFFQGQFIELGRSIEKLYQERGFHKTRINFEAKEIENNFIDARLVINEGPASVLQELTVLCQNEKLKERLLNQFKKHVGKTYNDKVSEKIISETEAYLIENRFLRAKVTEAKRSLEGNESQINLTIKIDNPFRYEFVISGLDDAEVSSQSMIRKILASSFAKSSQEASKYLSDFVKNEFLSLGHALVSVKVSEKIDGVNYRKEQIIDVDPGEQINIDKVIFNGLYTRPEKYYSDFLLSHSSEITEKRIYEAKGLQNGIENLKNELNNQGYLKAKVNLTEEKYLEDKANVHLVINLNEGPLTQLSEVKFTGTSVFDDTKLTQVIDLEKNSPLRLNKINEAIKKLTSFYADAGYLEMKITNSKSDLVTYNSSNTEATIQFDISEGPKISVREIVTEGNYKTKTHIVTRELTFKEGDVLTPEKIISSQKRLFGLGVFSEVRIETLEKNSKISDRMILIRLKEGKPRTIRFGAGVTNERNLTARGYVGFRHNNLFGTARVLDTRAEINNNIGDISYLERKITLSYLERFTIWPKNNLRISATNLTDVISISDGLVTILEESRLNFRFEYPFTNHFKLITNLYDLSFQKNFEQNGLDEETDTRIAQFGPTLEFDYRDNIFNPTSGSFTALSLRYADPAIGSSSGIQFVKGTAKTTHYFPFLKNWVWANSLRGGYILNLSSDSGSGVPASEAFFLGGRSTVRGFDSLLERYPSESDLGVNSIDDFIIEDASHFGLVKSEIRFPLFSSIGGAIFYDGGYVAVKGFDFENAYRESVGVGLHITTPVGPVNFEVGFKLDGDDNRDDSPWEFHFSIGSF